MLSADDLLTEGALSRAVAVMEGQPNVGLVYGRSLYFVSNDELPNARVRCSASRPLGRFRLDRGALQDGDELHLLA